jgi:hypothetical protein
VTRSREGAGVLQQARPAARVEYGLGQACAASRTTTGRRSMPDEDKAPASSDVVIESFRTQMEILQLMRKDAKSSQPDPAQLLQLAEAYAWLRDPGQSH